MTPARPDALEPHHAARTPSTIPSPSSSRPSLHGVRQRQRRWVGDAPHRPHRRPLGEDDLADGLETVTLVEPAVVGARRLEIAGGAVGIASLQHGGEQVATETAALYLERGVFPGGCFFAQLLAEFDAPRGPLHDAVVQGQRGWLVLLEQEIATAQEQGEIAAEVDPQQLSFELYAPLELANYLATLYDDATLVERGRMAVRATIAHATLRTINGRETL
jgi:hypothetical protein